MGNPKIAKCSGVNGKKCDADVKWFRFDTLPRCRACREELNRTATRLRMRKLRARKA